MSTFIVVLLIVNLVALAGLALRHRWLREEVADLRSRAQALSGESAAEVPEEWRRLAREGAAMLSVRILNPMELAAQKHWVAGVAGRVTPGLVRRIVTQEAAKILRQELPKYGVIAEVEVIGGRSAA